MYKYFFSIMLPVLAVMTTTPVMSGAPAPPPPPPVTLTCLQNYTNSSADDTCYNESFKRINSEVCRISANCWKNSYTNVFSAIEVNAANAGSVKNCSGRLKLSC